MPDQEPLTKKTVLVVEDDSVLRQAIVEQLKVLFNVFEAGSGEKALLEVEQHKPNVVILDLLLPGVTGFEVLERIRAHPDPDIASTKVIILSNLSPTEDIVKTKQLAISSYLTKSSISLDELSDRVKDALKGITINNPQ